MSRVAANITPYAAANQYDRRLDPSAEFAMPLSILHVIRSVNPAGGGPIEGLKQLTEVRTKQGHHVEVASLDAPTDPWVASFPYTLHPLGPAWGNYGYSPRFLPWLQANASRFDVVVANGLWQYSSFGVWRALHGGPVPYFVFTHGMLDPWFKRRYPLKHLKKWLYWPWAEYRVLRDARAVLFTTEQERLLARESFWLYRCNERVVNYGTASPPDEAEAQRSAFAGRFPQLMGKRVVLFLSRVHPKKGADLLIEAFARLLQERPALADDLQLVFAGPDDHAYALELKALCRLRGIERQVTWTGMLQGPLKWGVFRVAEVFALPSHQENFGIAVAEALACGVPVLISKEVNIWREIAADRAGFVAADDIPGTLDSLRGWFSLNDEARAAYRERAAASFRERFEIHGAAKSLIDTFLDCGVSGGARLADSSKDG